MASIYNDISAALETPISTVSGILSITNRNITFEPQTGTSFLQIMFLPMEHSPTVRGFNRQQRYAGVSYEQVRVPVCK